MSHCKFSYQFWDGYTVNTGNTSTCNNGLDGATPLIESPYFKYHEKITLIYSITIGIPQRQCPV